MKFQRISCIRLSEKFLSFYKEIDAQCFLFYIIFISFCSVEINTATFHRLGFAFVQRCIVGKNTFAKERHFSDYLISDVRYIHENFL